jgi:hypothetical protein
VYADPLPAYDAMREAAEASHGAARSRRGDPRATGPAILEIVDAAEPPLRVFFGDGPLEMTRAEYARRIETWERWADLSKRAHGEELTRA